MITMEELYTPKDVARILGITEYTVREKLKEKEIPGFRLYGRWKIRPEELRRYIQQQQDKQR